jgi:hypothetical protein
VGGVAGIVAIVNRGDESSACGPGGIGHCNGSDMSAVNGDRAAAVGAGTVADVGLIAGVALVGVGTLLYLLKPSSSARAPMGFVTRFGHGTRGGALEGKW